VALGRCERIARAIFVSGMFPVSMAPPSTNGAGESTVSAAERVTRVFERPREFKHSWPAVASGAAVPDVESWIDFGVAIRSHLREASDPVIVACAERVHGIFSRPWDDLPADHVQCGALDKLVSCALQGAPGGVPLWSFSRSHIREDRGLLALWTLCRQILMTTDFSDTDIKKFVRRPKRQTNALLVSRDSIQWDGHLSMCVDLRGFVIDAHERRTALLRIRLN
jgi:hypothetical protein